MSDTDTTYRRRTVQEMLLDPRPIAGGDGTGDDPDPTPDPAPADPGSDPAKDDPPEVDHAAEHKKWKSLARKHEQQAKANADAAKRLKDMEDKDKTEAQKAADRAAAAEKRAQDAEQKALRLEIASEKGVPASLLSGSTKEEMEESADALLEFRGKSDDGDTSKNGRPKEKLKPGASPGGSDSPTVEDLLKEVPRL